MEPFVDGGFRIGEKGTLLVPINVQVHLGHVYALFVFVIHQYC